MLRQRLLSGSLITALLLYAGMQMPSVGIWLLFLAVVVIGQLEFYRIVNGGGIPAFRVLGVLCGVALVTAEFWTVGPTAEHQAFAGHLQGLILALGLLGVFVRQFPQKNNDKPLATLGCTFLGVLYVPFLFNYIVRLGYGWNAACWNEGMGLTGFLLGFYLMAVVKLTDIGAYFTGRAFGRHKLFPRLSPAKTWEGFAGGIVVAMVGSLAFQHFTGGHFGKLTMGRIDAVILGALLSLSGVVGDLFESLLKRAGNVKDSSAIVPGMGGILDVIDSPLFGAPLLYYSARFFM